MNNDEKNVKLLENESSPVPNLSGSVLSFPGSLSPTLIDKRTVPLLYVQSPAVSKPAGNNNSSNVNNNESLGNSAGTFNVPKLAAPATLSPNGTKFVQVHSSNQNVAYVGTIFKSSTKGKDAISQKVLLTPVKGKDVPMARLILPRPPNTSPQANISPTSKQICRSFVVSPVSQGTLMTSGITVKAAEATGKIIQPNIIRQRSVEAKVLSPGGIMPSGIIVPNKGVVPPPGLTLLKSSSIQPQSGEKSGMKVVLVDIKESNEKIHTEPVAPSQHDPLVQENDVVEKSQIEAVEVNTSHEAETKGTVLEDVKEVALHTNIQLTEEVSSDSNVKTENLDAVQSESASKVAEIAKCDASAIKSPVLPVDSITAEPAPSTVVEPVSPEKTTGEKKTTGENSLENQESAPLKDSKDLTPETVSQDLLPPAAAMKEPISTSSVKETVNTPLPLPGSGERARKRKGSLSTLVSSPAKKIAFDDNYENMKLFPGGEEIDLFKVIDWDERGVGKLPELNFKLVVNDLNMIEIYHIERYSDSDADDSIQSHHQVDRDNIYRCVSCRIYGLDSEFFNENYCSMNCRDELYEKLYAIITKEPEVEISDKDKKKLPNETPPSKKALIESVKCSSKSLHKPLDNGDKISDQDIIEINESDSSGPESSLPKKRTIDDTQVNKVKKTMARGCKHSARKSEKLTKSSSSFLNNESTENKSKIKLRPRTAGKINRNLVTEENIAQDLDVGAHTFAEKEVSKKTSSFRWTTYLAETKASPAWVKLFSSPYPSKPNRFKVGHKLEAIDPEHQSYFCLVTVAEVKGYRLKLHFDGYPSEYDFWVNADSPNLFPSEFCNSHKIPLHPPPGVPMKTFDWTSYLVRNNARAAPQSCFENNLAQSTQTNLFKVDMKLEAVDRKNTFLVCVATVAAVMENRILIHFDSWGDMYDYWVDISSPYIRPVGWCQNNGHELTPPDGIKPENFSWKKYLRDTKSIAAPEKAFTLRPPRDFKKGMKIEAVDKRAPHLLRVATVVEILPYQVKISFDGFPPHFGYWVDDDSPDIHPVGWSSRAGHPLEPPPTAGDFESTKCPSPGCVGQGYLQGTKQETHSDVKNCPYSIENLGKETALTDRLKWSKIKRNADDKLPSNSEEESDEDIESIRWSWLRVRQSNKKSYKRAKEEVKKNECTPADSVSDPEEIKQIFGPPSPLPIDDIQERERSIEIKAENGSAEFDSKNTEVDKVNGFKIKSEENVDSESVQVKQEFQESDNASSSCDINKPISESKACVKSSKPTSEISIKQEKVETNEDNIKKEELPENQSNSIEKIIKREDDSLRPTPTVHVKEENETPEQSITDKRGENHHDFCREKAPEVFDSGGKTKLEEKNALFWNIHQVSQFARPLISCAEDCFLKEGIDGPGFLMLSKNDLLDYLGLSDSDAERVFRKISMLRQKVI